MALFFTLLLGSASMYVYWTHLPQNVDAAAPSVTDRPYPLTDLYAQWFGVRELLLHHLDPYGDTVTRELQVAYYGKELDPSHAALLTHQQRFAYPLYVTFLLAPTVRMQFRTVQIIFWWLLAAATAASVLLWARAVGAKLSTATIVVTFAVTFASIPVMQGLTWLQLGLLVAFIIAAAAAAVFSGRLFLAGVLLAVATIKPQMSLLAITWFILWVLGDWRKRHALLFGFACMLGALILASEWLMPTWLQRFPAAVVAYGKHTRVASLLDALLPAPLSWMAAIFVILVGLRFCWQALRQPADSFAFALAVASTLTLSTLVVPAVFQPFNYVLLIPVLLLVIRNWKDLLSASRLSRLGTYVSLALALLPWPLALAVNIGRLLPSFSWLQERWFAPLNATLALPFAALGFLILLQRNAGSQLSN